MASMRFSSVIIRVLAPSRLASRDLEGASSRGVVTSIVGAPLRHARRRLGRLPCNLHNARPIARPRNVATNFLAGIYLHGLFLLGRDAVDVFVKHGETGSHYREELERRYTRSGTYRRKFPRNRKVLNAKDGLRLS